MVTESFFQTASAEIHFVESPSSGPPLVLLHGLPGLWQEFLPLLPVLSLQWHVYALDFRGQGRSGRTPGQYQSKYYVADADEFLQRQLEEPAILFGLSAGGVVALKVAADGPELIRGVIVGDSPLDMVHLFSIIRAQFRIGYLGSIAAHPSCGKFSGGSLSSGILISTKGFFL